MVRPLAALFVALAALGCSPAAHPDPGLDASAPSSTTTASAAPSAAVSAAPSGSADPPAEPGLTLWVGPRLVDCEGEGPMKCMRVRRAAEGDWELLYQSIEGFTFEEGNAYELRVSRTPVDNPPAGGSSVRYALIEVVSKSAAPAP
jgi:hypothetical protein